jgi:Uma2 family endonuclease
MLQPIDEPPQRLSRAEFRAWATAQPRGRFERHSGVVVAMAPERAIHNRLKAATWLLLRQGIQANRLPCEALTDGMGLEIGDDDDFEPDAIVRCGERLADDATKVLDPLIVVEVLSPSTSATDRTTKPASGRAPSPCGRPRRDHGAHRGHDHAGSARPAI